MNRLRSGDPEQQDAAFTELMAASRAPVDWAYDVWDELVALLTDPSNRARAIAAQALCNLAASDPDERVLRDFDRLLEVTRDERFVTARHCMQSLWKVGLAGERQRRRLLAGLELRYRECVAEKNRTLIRYDIIEVLKKVHDLTGDEAVRESALAWIELEEDEKYRKKYARLWPPPRAGGSAARSRIVPALLVLAAAAGCAREGEPAPESAGGALAREQPACPGGDFASFFAAFADDPGLQRAWTTLPLEDAALVDDEPEPRMRVDSLSAEELPLPLVPSARERAADSRELSIEELPDGGKRVVIARPDTDWVVHYVFAPTAECWRLVRREDWSL